MKAPLFVCFLLSCAAVAKTAFTFQFEIARHITNGDCFGFDFTIPCETFVNDFCLRGPSYVGDTNTDRNDCPLGKNTNRVFEDAPQTRTIESELPWPGSFQLFMGAHDDDSPATTFDFLDNIFVDEYKAVGSQFSAEERFWGVNNKVGVDISFRVTCQSDYYSGDCSVYCVPRDDSLGHYTCDPVDGSRVCSSGYEHPETNCVNRITACSFSPCTRGSCTPIGTAEFTCSCPGGYTGEMCETEINECAMNPCLNEGNCTDLLADYSCTCVPGYTGKDCDLDVNECLVADCVENAHCVHGINTYECICNVGFEGPNCTEIEPCDSSPCAVTGQCQSTGPFQYNCSCDSGFTGLTCDINIDDCPGSDCPENSECVDGVNSYTCVCLPGFTGENCTKTPVIVGAGTSSAATIIGGAVGGLMAFILLLLILIVIVVIVLSKRRRSRRKYSVPENPYNIEPSVTTLPRSGDPLDDINNPLYSTNSSTSPEHILGSQNPDSHHDPDFEMSASPAYASTPRDVKNPLYGSTLSPEHSANSPIYSEPVKSDSAPQQKGAQSYPYSYAIVDRDRRTDSTKSSMKAAPPPNYEQVVKGGKSAGPQYEDVELKPVLNGDTPTSNGYQVPKPATTSQSSVPQPLVYHYATTESTAKQKPPKLGDAVATSQKNTSKKSIYDSQDDGADHEEVPSKPTKPVPPPRTKPAASKPSEVYSYTTTTDAARASIKVKGLGGADSRPYNRLEHELGSNEPGLQIRLAKVEGLGYETLQND